MNERMREPPALGESVVVPRVSNSNEAARAVPQIPDAANNVPETEKGAEVGFWVTALTVGEVVPCLHPRDAGYVGCLLGYWVR